MNTSNFSPFFPYLGVSPLLTDEYPFYVSFAQEMQAAGIHSPSLIASYRECRRLNAEHGKTYYLATLLLPPARRPHVHALYGFARYADEIVDAFDDSMTVDDRRVLLKSFADEIMRDLRRGESSHAVGAALIHTAKCFSIPLEYFEAFLDSMAMDLAKVRYENYDELERYMYGSASVIGLQMLPILGSTDPAAMNAAKALGEAFQLANFIRDVNEDLDRGRIYLPLDELAQFGVTESMLVERRLTPELRNALIFQISRVRELQEYSATGIALLDPVSRPCIEAASELYCGIVDEVEAINYEIFSKRAHVSTWRKIRVALPAYLRALFIRATL